MFLFLHFLFWSCAVFSSTNKNPSTPEKITVAGFVIFSLIVLTAYTATSAAFLVSIGNGYQSIDDMISSSKKINVCIPKSLEGRFIEENPQASSVLTGMDMSAESLLREVGGECKGVIISADAFVYLQQKDEDLCRGVKILLSKILLTIENVIPTYELLGDIGQELIRKTNVLIEEGVYTEWHSIYTERFEKINYEIKYNNRSRMLRGGKGKGSASAAGGQNVANHAIGSCGSSDEIDLDKFQLSDIHLLMPISLSLTCSTVGLVIFLVNRAKKSAAVQSTAAAVITLNEKNEERLLRQGLRKMSAYSLIDMLETEKSVSAADIEAAMNLLPEKDKLIDLAFLVKCTENRRDYYTIMELSVSELCKVIEYYNTTFGSSQNSLYDGVQRIELPRKRGAPEDTSSDSSAPDMILTNAPSEQSKSWGRNLSILFTKNTQSLKEPFDSVLVEDALNDCTDPKGELIEAILKVPITRRMALRCARIKVTYLSEGNSDEFNITDHIIGRSPACASGGENASLLRSSEISQLDERTVEMASLRSINVQKAQSRRKSRCIE